VNPLALSILRERGWRVAPFVALAALGVCLTLAGCGTTLGPKSPQQIYDFGLPPPAAGPRVSSSGLVVPIAETSSWLDSPALTYRLGYAAANEPKAYANSRWAMPPAELLTRRIRVELSAKAQVVNVADTSNQLLLRVDLEEFSQVFDAPESSHAFVQFRATLVRAGRVIGQRTFAAQQAAITPNAAGGAAALAAASASTVAALSGWVDEMVP
jgi:cholesterol transport system auxiliary component